MSSPLKVSEAARNFPEYIERVVRRGEHFVLIQDREAVAELRPVTQRRRLRDLPELLASLPHLSPEDLASFENDLEEARNELGQIPIQTPWES
jgi:antitoxin (DNA-binding transcriptional repressor) of toxin-antitoxin stability system